MRSFLAEAVVKRATNAPTATSSKVTPKGRPVARKKELAGSPPKVEDKAIKLSFGSDRRYLRVKKGIAESGPIVEQIAVDPSTVAKSVEAEEEAGGRVSPVDQAPKRPRVEGKASGPKSHPRIISDPSERLQDVLLMFCVIFFGSFANSFTLAGSLVFFKDIKRA